MTRIVLIADPAGVAGHGCYDCGAEFEICKADSNWKGYANGTRVRLVCSKCGRREVGATVRKITYKD